MIRSLAAAAALAITVSACATVPDAPHPLAGLARTGTVSDRFQSYNVEMVEVTGGRFWAPYGGPADEVYRMRPPVELSNERLRQLARHLGPAYVRVSGTWANSTYLPAKDETAGDPPDGYKQVLTRDQWRGVVDFVGAVDGAIVTSFAVSPGTRGADGVWQTEQAQRLIDLTREAGGTIAAAEFYNEPNASMVGGLPEGYGADDYARDFRIFIEWARKAAPDMTVIGPGSVGEGAIEGVPVNALRGAILSRDMLPQIANTLDGFSYHFYGNVSQRCAAMRPSTAQKDEALSPEWLDLTLRDLAYYEKLRDRFEPGDPMWITETAQAACGGSPWASTFLDSFRYVNQLGLLAQHDVQVVMHNTLAASDYALLDDESFEPCPNYWAAVLWRRTMGSVVLTPPPSPSPELRIYAHCLPGAEGGVGLAVINLGDSTEAVETGTGGKAWVMQAQPVDSRDLRINGNVPGMDTAGRLTGLEGQPVASSLSVPGKSIAFVTAPMAGNAACTDQ